MKLAPHSNRKLGDAATAARRRRRDRRSPRDRCRRLARRGSDRRPSRGHGALVRADRRSGSFGSPHGGVRPARGARLTHRACRRRGDCDRRIAPGSPGSAGRDRGRRERLRAAESAETPARSSRPRRPRAPGCSGQGTRVSTRAAMASRSTSVGCARWTSFASRPRRMRSCSSSARCRGPSRRALALPAKPPGSGERFRGMRGGE